MADSADKKRASKDSIGHTLTVAVLVSLVCSVLVSTAATLLKPRQQDNQERYRQRIVLEIAGLYEPGEDVAALFAGIEPRLVDLATGDYVDADNAADYDFVAAASGADTGVDVAPGQDVAGIGRRSRYMPVYLVRDGGEINQVILPVYGKGLWSTMRGFLALERDGTTVRGLQFYEHAETPGLGDQIDKAGWRSQWVGKQMFDDDGELRIEVARGLVEPGPDSIHQVDGLSGATLTGRGVMNLLRYWGGPDGYGPYLEKVRNGDIDG